MLLSKINGLIVPLLTPMIENNTVDYFGLKNLTARLMNKGVKNFFILGPLSEQEFIPYSEHKKVISNIVKEVGAKGNVLIGCFSESAEEIIEKVKFAERYSQYCVINLPYSALTSEMDFIDFFDTLFNKTKTNVFLYNDPKLFGRNIPVSGLNKIVGWERLIGFMDNSKNMSYFKAVADYHQSIKIYQVDEALAVESLNYNSSGNAVILANVVPELFINLKNEFENFGYNSLIRQELSIISLNDKFSDEKKIQSIKKILSDFGIIQENFAKELPMLTKDDLNLINSLIRRSFA